MTKYKFKKYRKKSGTLVPFSLKKDIPFKTKRMFIIYGNKNFTRGNHAHYRCSQFLVPVFGSMEINFEDKKSKTLKKINYKKKTGVTFKAKDLV